MTASHLLQLKKSMVNGQGELPIGIKVVTNHIRFFFRCVDDDDEMFFINMIFMLEGVKTLEKSRS